VRAIQEFAREEQVWQSTWDNTLQHLNQQLRSAEWQNKTKVLSTEDSIEYERSIMEIQQKLNALEADDPWSMFQSRFPQQP
jgi:uncharacterized coiled-coil DUF342 family protein